MCFAIQYSTVRDYRGKEGLTLLIVYFVAGIYIIDYLFILKTTYGFETVIPLYITGYREKIYSESAVVAKRRRLTRAIYFLPTAGDIKRYHRLKTVISLVSGFFLTLYACREIQ